jgi:hypothetical protein
MPDISLTPPTYKRLLQRVTSFDDQPEDVIVRLLDEAEGGGAPADPVPDSLKAPSRAAPGSVLPIRAYWVPILQVLVEKEGAAHSNDVIDALETRMAEMFTERDRQPLQSGAIRWRSRARFARLRMKEAGLLSDSSHRGVWEITPQGRAFLALEEKTRSD